MTNPSSAAAGPTDADPSNVAEPFRERRGRSKAPQKRSLKLFLRDVALILVAALVISFLIKTFLIRSFYIPSPSMEDTLLTNDRIIVNELTPDLMPLKHGDVVVFEDPGGWLGELAVAPKQTGIFGVIDSMLNFIGLSASQSNDHLIKRVIGLPGDHVTCCDDFGRVTVNGVSLDEPYILLTRGTTAVPPEDEFDVTVPKGELWVLGDNRDNSADSAYHRARNDPGGGFVPIKNVTGRAIVISWPVGRWTWIDDYASTFAGVDGKHSG